MCGVGICGRVENPSPPKVYVYVTRPPLPRGLRVGRFLPLTPRLVNPSPPKVYVYVTRPLSHEGCAWVAFYPSPPGPLSHKGRGGDAMCGVGICGRVENPSPPKVYVYVTRPPLPQGLRVGRFLPLTPRPPLPQGERG